MHLAQEQSDYVGLSIGDKFQGLKLHIEKLKNMIRLYI